MLLGTGESGKSTLLGVLLTDKLDDGKGRARIKILNHKHEVLTGVTSSLTYTVIGFDSYGNILNKKNQLNTWESTIDSSRKIITFIDCGGHEKYHRNTLQAFLKSSPDFMVLVLNIQDCFKDVQKKLNIAIALQINFSILITHVDLFGQKRKNLIIKYVSQLDSRCLQ